MLGCYYPRKPFGRQLRWWTLREPEVVHQPNSSLIFQDVAIYFTRELTDAAQLLTQQSIRAGLHPAEPEPAVEPAPGAVWLEVGVPEVTLVVGGL